MTAKSSGLVTKALVSNNAVIEVDMLSSVFTSAIFIS